MVLARKLPALWMPASRHAGRDGEVGTALATRVVISRSTLTPARARAPHVEPPPVRWRPEAKVRESDRHEPAMIPL